MRDVMAILYSFPGSATDAPIFIGGAARSGTTLLRVVLDAHSRIACGLELKIGGLILSQWQEARRHQALVPDGQVADAHEIDRLYARLFAGLLESYRLRTGKARVAEKSPNNVFVFGGLGQLFPDASFVHLIRDGRDVVASLLRQTHWRDAETGGQLSYTQDARTAARYWVAAVKAGRDAGRQLGPRYLEMRYEDLVTEPADVMACLLEWLGESFEEDMLTTFHARVGADEPNAAEAARPIHRQSVGAWRGALDESQVAAVMEVAGPMLAELGYHPEAARFPPGAAE